MGNVNDVGIRQLDPISKDCGQTRVYLTYHFDLK